MNSKCGFFVGTLLAFISFAAITSLAHAQSGLQVSGRTKIVAGPGELEVAVSANGRNVLVAVNALRPNPVDIARDGSNLFHSIDGGKTFKDVGVTNVPSPMADSRDPTVAWTGKGKFYLVTMGGSQNALVASSADQGATFSLTLSSVRARCRGEADCATDQPHMAGDRRPGEDQIYIVWRNSPKRDTSFFSVIECSPDGGKTWMPSRVIDEAPLPANRRGDYPRVTVGKDGFVYVLMTSRRTNGDLFLQRFSPCSDGLIAKWETATHLSDPSKIGTFVGVKCEAGNTLAGLDRCNTGNIMASPTIAVDEDNPRRVFVSFADENAFKGHDIVLLWTDDVTHLAHDTNFQPRQIMNVERHGQRYFPWMCTTQSSVYAGWYDRRAQTARDNDITEYFLGNVTKSPTSGTIFGNNPSKEVDVSNALDLQCASGWPTGGEQKEAEACSRQPQNAGFCLACTLGTGCKPTKDTPRCDYSANNCTEGLSCQGERGNGKYGDYNGIACAQGSAFVAWASAAAPAGLKDVDNITVFFARIAPPSPPRPALTPTPQVCINCAAQNERCVAEAGSGPENKAKRDACANTFLACQQAPQCQ